MPSRDSVNRVLGALVNVSEAASSAELCGLSRLSISTVRSALRQLITDGLVERVETSRRVVSSSLTHDASSRMLKYRLSTMGLVFAAMDRAVEFFAEYDYRHPKDGREGVDSTARVHAEAEVWIFCAFTMHGLWDDAVPVFRDLSVQNASYRSAARFICALVVFSIGGGFGDEAIERLEALTIDGSVWLDIKAALAACARYGERFGDQQFSAVQRVLERGDGMPYAAKVGRNRFWRKLVEEPDNCLGAIQRWADTLMSTEAVARIQAARDLMRAKAVSVDGGVFGRHEFLEVQRSYREGGPVSGGLCARVESCTAAGVGIGHYYALLASVYIFLCDSPDPVGLGGAVSSMQQLGRYHRRDFDWNVTNMDLLLWRLELRRNSSHCGSKSAKEASKRAIAKVRRALRESFGDFRNWFRNTEWCAEAYRDACDRYFEAQVDGPRSADGARRLVERAPTPSHSQVIEQIRSELDAGHEKLALSLMCGHFSTRHSRTRRAAEGILDAALELDKLVFADRVLLHFGPDLSPQVARRYRDELHRRRGPEPHQRIVPRQSPVLEQIGTRRPANKQSAVGTVGSPYPAAERRQRRSRRIVERTGEDE